MAEVCLIDGSALAPTSFGEFDSDSPNIWKPIDPSGITFGPRGQWLDFADGADLGDDNSGNSLDFAETNLAAIDQTTDTPTNNFAVWNPLTNRDAANGTWTEGNLRVVASTGDMSRYCTLPIPLNFKFYFEVKAPIVGAQADGSIIGFAVDCANGRIHMHIDGTYLDSSDPTDNDPNSVVTGFSTTVNQYLHMSLDTRGASQPIMEFNFGNPVFSISSGNTDANGYGNFEYAVPSGYLAFCTKNMADY